MPKRDSKKPPVDPKKKLVTRKPRPAQRAVSLLQTDPLLAAYLREAQKYSLLDRDTEHDLALRWYEKKDRNALHSLITSNLRFVVKIAFEYVHYRVKLLDLIQEGNIGLVKAVQDFNPYKEVRLTTYAVWWIRSYIQDSILKNYSLVKIGTTQAQKRLFYRLRREQRKLEQMGILPHERTKLLASRLDVREKDVEEMQQRLARADVSLNAPLKGDEKKEHLENLTDTTRPVDETLGDAEQREIFHKILMSFGQTLEGREKIIFQERLTSENPMTLQEIGDKYGVTKERARQIEEEIKERLKNYVKERFPDYQILSGAN